MKPEYAAFHVFMCHVFTPLVCRMPTLPLLSPTSVPDAWHNVTAPGGYDWWYFDAEDVANDRQIVAILLDGFGVHPGYLRAYARYRRWPACLAAQLPLWFRSA